MTLHPVSHKPSTDFLSTGSSAYRTPMSPSTLLLGRAREEELKLLYKDPNNYQNNVTGLVLFRLMSITVIGLIGLVAYNGGFHSINTLEDLEDVQFWQRIWNSSVPLWSILIANFGILFISAIVIESKRMFLKTPKKPLVLLIIAVMSVSSLILFLHPLDEVFYPGMLMVLLQNYFWVVLMVKPDDPMANLVHPYLHHTQVGKSWNPFVSTKNLKAQNVERRKSFIV